MKNKILLLISLSAMALCGCGTSSSSSVILSKESSHSVLSSSSMQSSDVSSTLSSLSSKEYSSIISPSSEAASSSIVAPSSSVGPFSSKIEPSSSEVEPSSSFMPSSSKEESSSSILKTAYYLTYKDSVPSYDINQGLEFLPAGTPGIYYVYESFITGDELRITDGISQYSEYDLSTEEDNAYFEGLFIINSRNNIRINASGLYYIEFDTTKEENNVFIQAEKLEKCYRIYETNFNLTYYEDLTYKADKTDISKITYFLNNQCYSSSRSISVRFVIRGKGENQTFVKNISLGPNTPSTFVMTDDQYLLYHGNSKTVYSVLLYVNTTDLSLTLDFIKQ